MILDPSIGGICFPGRVNPLLPVTWRVGKSNPPAKLSETFHFLVATGMLGWWQFYLKKSQVVFFSTKQSPGKDYVELLRFVTPYKTLSSGLVKAVYFCWPCCVCWQRCYELKIPISTAKSKGCRMFSFWTNVAIHLRCQRLQRRNKQTTLRTPCVSDVIKLVMEWTAAVDSWDERYRFTDPWMVDFILSISIYAGPSWIWQKLNSQI